MSVAEFPIPSTSTLRSLEALVRLAVVMGVESVAGEGLLPGKGGSG